MKKVLIIIGAIIILAAVAWFIIVKKPAIPGLNIGAGNSPEVATEPSSSLGGELFNAIKQNPADNIPDTNPFQNNLNPYNSGYTNPF